MQPSSEQADDGFALLTNFKVTPALTNSRQVWLSWTWKSSSLAQQLFQQIRLIHQNELELQLLGQHVITDPSVQSYAIGNLRPNIEYLVCLRLTRQSVPPPADQAPLMVSGNNSGHSVANLTGYVAEMECRLVRTQALHWLAFVTSLLGVVAALVLALAVYLLVRHWHVKTRQKYQQELQHHHHHVHLHVHKRLAHPESVKCGHASGHGGGSTTTSEGRRPTQSGMEEPSGWPRGGGCLLLLPPTTGRQSAAPVEAPNTPSPGPYSLSGSESYQITSTSSTTEEHVCCHSPDAGSTSAQKPFRGDPSEGRQTHQNRRTVSFLVSEKSTSQQRHAQPLARSSARSTLKTISSPPVTLGCGDRDANTSDLSGSLVGDAEAPPLVPRNPPFDSPILSPQDNLSVSTEVPLLPTTFSVQGGQTEVESGTVGVEQTTPVFYTQLIETI